MLNRTTRMAAALLLAAGTTASAQSISTGFSGTTTTGGATPWMGMFFDVTALNAQGITITSWDIHSNQTAGTPLDVRVWVKQGTFVGFNTDESAWTLIGEAATVAAGVGQPTPVAIGDFFIPSGELWGVRVGVSVGAQRYDSSFTTPVFNSDVQIDLGMAQGTLWVGGINNRAWNGTIYYDIGNTAAFGACCLVDGTCADMGQVLCVGQGGVFQGANTECALLPPCPPPPEGACCMPDGSCNQATAAACDAAGGAYSGDNTDCATIPPCPQPGACCLQWGDCQVLSQEQCEELTGANFQGHGTSCPATCQPSGGCCLADGSCVVVTEQQCTSIFSGSFAGAGVNCGEARCATAPVLWNHGPIITDLGIGCAAGDLSALNNNAPIGGSSLGFNWNNASNSRLADQFIVPEGEMWTISNITLWGYDTNATLVSYTGAFIQIWDGDPTDPASTVVAGDLTTNRLTDANLTNSYRATVLAPSGCLRHIQRLDTNFEATLGPGTYWIDRAATVSGGGGLGTPWMPPVTFTGLAGKPHATGMAFFASQWIPRIDSGNEVQQDMPFVLIGTVEPDCYANCDGSTQEPILTVDDFTCFINAFATAQALPHEQQITHYANCDGSTQAPVLTVDDFTCFINEFAQGCP